MTFLFVAYWSIGIIIVVCNLISIVSNAIICHDKRELKNYERYVIVMNSSDLMIGLYLIIMSSVDIIFGDNYVEIDLS